MNPIPLSDRTGTPQTLADRRAAAMRILSTQPQLSDRSIAATACLSPNTVAALRRRCGDQSARPNSRLGRDGRVRPLDATAGRRAAGEVIARQPEASLREVARRAGVSVGTARDVRFRIRNGQQPVPARPSRSEPAGDQVPGRPAVQDTLQVLRSDPTLRYSDSGRELLRWLGGRAVAPEHWQELVDRVPPHCAVLIQDLARSCAAAWSELAAALQRRAADH